MADPRSEAAVETARPDFPHHHPAPEFASPWWLPGSFFETVVPSGWPRHEIAGHERLVVRVAPEASLRLHVSRPPGPARGTLVLFHGLGGCARSNYMTATAESALRRGLVVARVNLRNCGGTAELSQTLLNAGQSDDVGHVLAGLAERGFPRPFAAVGFSLGANLLLRYAGRAGAAAACDAAAAVNPPVDLEACASALERSRDLFFQKYFTWLLCGQLREIRRIRPVPGPQPLLRTVRTLRRFDQLYTAPDAGHDSAESYYAAASSAPELGKVRVPTLVLSAKNDPIIPVEIYTPHHGASTWLRFSHPVRGAHCGYWQSRRPRFWAGEFVLDFLAAALRLS